MNSNPLPENSPAAEPKSAATAFDCPVRNLRVEQTRFYHLNWSGSCPVYSYLCMAFCEREQECKQTGVYAQCPLLKELMEQNG